MKEWRANYLCRYIPHIKFCKIPQQILKKKKMGEIFENIFTLNKLGIQNIDALPTNVIASMNSLKICNCDKIVSAFDWISHIIKF